MMTRRSVCLIAALAAVLPVLAMAGQRDEGSVPRVSLADFKKGLDAGTVVALDVRDGASFQNGHIPGALSMPLADIQTRAAELRGTKKTLVTYCA